MGVPALILPGVDRLAHQLLSLGLMLCLVQPSHGSVTHNYAQLIAGDSLSLQGRGAYARFSGPDYAKSKHTVTLCPLWNPGKTNLLQACTIDDFDHVDVGNPSLCTWVVERGDCPFVHKAESVLAAGGAGMVVILDGHSSMWPPVMASPNGYQSDPGLKSILSLSISSSTWSEIQGINSDNSDSGWKLQVDPLQAVSPNEEDDSAAFGKMVLFAGSLCCIVGLTFSAYRMRMLRDRRALGEMLMGLGDEGRAVPEFEMLLEILPKTPFEVPEAKDDGGESGIESSTDSCCICMEDFVPSETLVRHMPCTHVFCADCIDEWLHYNRQCPLCKADVYAAALMGISDNVSESPQPQNRDAMEYVPPPEVQPAPTPTIVPTMTTTQI